VIELDSHQALSIVERIRAELAESHTGAHPQFTSSFGVTDTTAADTLEQLMHIADTGQYRAKQDGRDRAVIGQPTPQPPPQRDRNPLRTRRPPPSGCPDASRTPALKPERRSADN